MIEVKTNNGNTSVSIKGSLHELTVDTAIIMRSIWRGISEGNPDGGRLFAEMIQDIINNPKVSPFVNPGVPDVDEVPDIRIDFAELKRQIKEEHDGKMD